MQRQDKDPEFKHDSALELTQPLLANTEQKTPDIEHVVDINTSTLSFKDHHLEAYFFKFLDIESLANLAFTSRAVKGNVVKHIDRFKVSDEDKETKIVDIKNKFYLGLKTIAYTNEIKKRISDCKFALEEETQDTLLRKTGRHLSWITPYFSGVGGLIYGCVEKSGVADMYYAAKEKLHSQLTSDKLCSYFFVTRVADDPKWPYMYHLVESSLCNTFSSEGTLVTCRAVTDACKACIASCGNLDELTSNYNSEWYKSAGFGVGCIATAVVGGFVVALTYEDQIQQILNPHNKKVKQLSKETQSSLERLELKELKSSDKVGAIINRLDNVTYQLDNQAHFFRADKKLANLFLMFQATLPREAKILDQKAEEAQLVAAVKTP